MNKGFRTFLIGTFDKVRLHLANQNTIALSWPRLLIISSTWILKRQEVLLLAGDLCISEENLSSKAVLSDAEWLPMLSKVMALLSLHQETRTTNKNITIWHLNATVINPRAQSLLLLALNDLLGWHSTDRLIYGTPHRAKQGGWSCHHLADGRQWHSRDLVAVATTAGSYIASTLAGANHLPMPDRVGNDDHWWWQNWKERGAVAKWL